jgi:AcrR family transcriptional regulator
MSVLDERLLNRAERRRLHTRDQLMQAAQELMFEKGYGSLTIKAITERADLGYGTFYLHFADKDDIVWALLYQFMHVWEAETNERLRDVPFPRREFMSWVFIFDYADKARESFKDIFGRQGSTVLLQRYQDHLAELHESNMRAGLYTAKLDVPLDFLAQFITGALMRLLIWWVETPNTYTALDMARMLYQTVYRQPPPE